MAKHQPPHGCVRKPDPASYGGEISSCWRRSCVLGWVSRMERIPFAGRVRSSLSRMERRAPVRRLSAKKSARGAALSTSQSLLRVKHHGLRDWQVAVIESWLEAED